MKIFHSFAFMCMASAMISVAYTAEETKPAADAPAAEAPKPAPVTVVNGFLPSGTFASGMVVDVKFDQGLKSYLEKFELAASKLSKEDQEALKKSLKPGMPVPFDERFGMSKDEYDKYIECWNKREVVNVMPAIAGFTKSDTANEWIMTANTERGATPLSTLRYNDKKDEWISPNGTLERKPDLVYTELNNLGAWTAHEWLLEKKDDFSHVAENVLIGKTADGKFIYVIYNYLEVSSLGTPIDNKTIVLRFADEKTKAGSLQDRAKRNAGAGHNL